MSTKQTDSLICGVPPSKSHSMRALLFGAMADGESRIENLLDSPDVRAMIKACEALGAELHWENKVLVMHGGRPSDRDRTINAANSGQVLRFIGALAALSSSQTIITGDQSVLKRPLKPLISALEQLGGCASGPPLCVRGPIQPGTARLSGEDSQPVSALLMATPFLDGPTELIVDNPGEQSWIDLTLSWLQRLGFSVTHENYSHYRIEPGRHSGFSYRVPADFSSAAYPLVAALLTGREITLKGLDFDDVQGDKRLFSVLEEMGTPLRGIEIDLNEMIDMVTLLAVIGCCAEGTTRLYNGAIARKKECDRIAAICCELKKMGAKIEEREDGLVVSQSRLRGARVKSYGDHRMAMALHIAGMVAEGETEIEGKECVNKSYPNFFEEISF